MIALDEYKHLGSAWTLRSCKSSARQLKSLFDDSAETEIAIHSPSVPEDRAELLQYIKDAVTQVGRNGFGLLYYAGHAQVIDGYLYLFHSSVHDPGNRFEMISIADVIEIISASQIKRGDPEWLVFLDCCVEGELAESVGRSLQEAGIKVVLGAVQGQAAYQGDIETHLIALIRESLGFCERYYIDSGQFVRVSELLAYMGRLAKRPSRPFDVSVSELGALPEDCFLPVKSARKAWMSPLKDNIFELHGNAVTMARQVKIEERLQEFMAIGLSAKLENASLLEPSGVCLRALAYPDLRMCSYYFGRFLSIDSMAFSRLRLVLVTSFSLENARVFANSCGLSFDVVNEMQALLKKAIGPKSLQMLISVVESETVIDITTRVAATGTLCPLNANSIDVGELLNFIIDWESDRISYE